MKKIKAIAASLAVVSMLAFAGCANNAAEAAKNEYLLPTNHEYLVDSVNKLYEANDSDSGGIVVYYKDGRWATYKNGKFYSLQQYMLPKNRAGSLYDEVKNIPTFNEDNVTYMGYDAATGDVLSLDKNMSFIDINNTYNSGSVSVYVEWQDGDYYYSYVMQYGDVSILYTHIDELNLFRGYTAYLNSKYPVIEQGTTGTEAPASSETVSESAETTAEGTEQSAETTEETTAEGTEQSVETTSAETPKTE